MKEYKIEVKGYMLKHSTPEFTFMTDMNHDEPMPLKIMYGIKLAETPGMVKMRLHGDIKEMISQRCMMCGKPITNSVSRYFGIGPKCGGHNYVNPFDSEKELHKAVEVYRQNLVNKVWTGWIIKSAIELIDDKSNVDDLLRSMPTEADPDYIKSNDSDNSASEKSSLAGKFTINAKIDKPCKGTDDYSVFLTFKYNSQVVAAVKQLNVHCYNPENKTWEIEYREFDNLRKLLPDCAFNVTNEEILPKHKKITYKPKTMPMQHQIEGIQYGLKHNRWLLGDEQGCVSGDSFVKIKEQGKPATRNIKIKYLKDVFDNDNTVKIKSLVNGRFAYMPIKAVVDKGIQKTVELTLEDTSIQCTPDHLIYTENGWVEADKLNVGDKVFTNGVQTCPMCGTTENLVTYKYSKFLGYCKSCMYAHRNGTKYNEITKKLDKDGYVRLFGIATRTMPNYDKVHGFGIYEHHQVWYENTGHIVDTATEVVHHKNGIKTDNRFENLQLMPIAEHDKLHSDTKTNHLYQFNENLDFIERNGTKIYLKPRLQEVKAKTSLGSQQVWDIAIDSNDIHNFICNNIVVHNCGKTKQLIDLAIIRKQHNDLKHCLIICGVNSLKWNWLEEIAKHSNESGWILGMHRTKRTHKLVVGSNADKLADLNKIGNDAEIDSHFFIITNIESLRNKAIASKLSELCETDIIGMVAIDEIHRAKRTDTHQGEGMLQLQPTYRVAMTGTPLINSPLDLYAILKWLGYQRYGFYSYKNYFCKVDPWGNVCGYKNIDELRGQLDSIMLRRLKSEVLDLPEKVYTNEYVELSDEQVKLYNHELDYALTSEECRLALNLRLRQIAGGIAPYDQIKHNAKLDRLEQLVEEAVYSGTKVIVYSNWIGGLAPAIERLHKYNPVVITGETNDSDRQAIVNRFQTDDTVKVFCGTIGAVGTGLTLTAATEVIFLDEPWSNAAKEQACDRAHRIGTKSTVNIHTIIGHGTYDERVHEIVLGKRDDSDHIIDKKDLANWKL